MAGKISDMAALTDPATVLSTDLMEIVASGANKKVAPDVLLDAMFRASASYLGYIAGRYVTFATRDGGDPSIGAVGGPLVIGAAIAGIGTYFNESTGDQQVAAAYQRVWTNGSASSGTPDVGMKRAAAGVVAMTNGSSGAGWLQNAAGRTRTTVQVDATTATLANLTALAVTVAAGRTYKFIASLPVTADAVGGYKVAIAGTCTATTIYYDVISETNGIAPGLSRQSALGGAASGSLGTTVRIRVEGLITVNAGGTLVPQFAQSGANGTSSVLAGADFAVDDVP